MAERKRTVKPRHPPRENPKRLRECLEALAQASDRTVMRIELEWTDRGVKLLFTCAPSVKEDVIAGRIVNELRPYFEALLEADKGAR